MIPRGTLAVLLLVGALTACSEPPRRNVVIVTLDTTRRDRLSLYGYRRPTTPEIDAVAARGAVFLDAWSQAPNTNPSIASTLTSRRAPVTKVRGNAEKLDPAVPTIARVAKDAGYRTGAFVSTALLRSDAAALDPGFDVYDDEMTDPCWGHENGQRVARKTIDGALAWLASSDERPFLLWVHLYDPHGPYTAPEATPELDDTRTLLPAGVDLTTWRGPERIPKYLRVDGLTEPREYADAYDREIRYADRHLGRLFAALDLETTVVALHADHGEALGEDAYWFRHGNLLHDPALRIPMVIVGPGVAPLRHDAPMRNLDLVPTVCALAGLPGPPDAEGLDRSREIGEPRQSGGLPTAFVAEGRRREIVRDDTGIDTRWKLRFRNDVGTDVTWWPAADERRVAHGDPDDVLVAMKAMRRWLHGDEADGGAPDDLPSGLDDALRGLGYTSPSETTSPPATRERSPR